MTAVPPFVDVEAIRDQVVELYDVAPYQETAYAILVALTDAGEQLSAVIPDLHEAHYESLDEEQRPEEPLDFGVWKKAEDAFFERISWYSDAAEGASDEGDVVEFVLDPLLDGEYPDELWRLMNQLTSLVTNQIPEDSLDYAYQSLHVSYTAVLELFWDVLARELTSAADQLPEDYEGETDDSLREAADMIVGFKADTENMITMGVPTSSGNGAGALALGVLGIGALLLIGSRRRRR
jgi:hypothetical protein